MMQDWLLLHKLDRKVLANLALNLTQVEAYENYIAHEVKGTLEGIMQAVITKDESTAQDAAEKTQSPVAQQKETEQGAFTVWLDSSCSLLAAEAEYSIKKPAETF